MRKILGPDKVEQKAQQAIKNFHPEVVQRKKQAILHEQLRVVPAAPRQNNVVRR